MQSSSVAQRVKDSAFSIVTTMAQVAAVVQVQSLARELPHAMDTAPQKRLLYCVCVCVCVCVCTYMEYQTPRSYPSTKALNKLQGLSEPNLLEIQSKV